MGYTVFLASGGAVDLPEADGYTILGGDMRGVLKLWKLDPERKQNPELVAVFAAGGWLGFRGRDLLDKDEVIGFRPRTASPG